MCLKLVAGPGVEPGYLDYETSDQPMIQPASKPQHTRTATPSATIPSRSHPYRTTLDFERAANRDDRDPFIGDRHAVGTERQEVVADLREHAIAPVAR